MHGGASKVKSGFVMRFGVADVNFMWWAVAKFADLN
jgi:hypothetical protein